MNSKKIYQIEIFNEAGEQNVPMGLFDWQVFETKEDAQAYVETYADEFVGVKYDIVEYDEDDIEDYSIIKMPVDMKGNRIHINDKVKWHDPGINDYDEEDREEVLNRIWSVDEINITGEDDSIIQIGSGSSETEVLASELEIVEK